LHSTGEQPFTFGIRIPGWADEYILMRNGEKIEVELQEGYAYITDLFQDEELILSLDMKIEKWYAHPYVKSDTGKVAIARGPVVYCMEEADNGSHLNLLYLQEKTDFHYYFSENELGGIGVIEAEGYKELPEDALSLPLYKKGAQSVIAHKKTIRWIPYYVWANRGSNEMQVWIREKN
jgi:hypothetical protein